MMTNDLEKTVPENERESTGEENKKEENVQSAATKEDMADKERAYRTLKADRRQLQQNQEMLMAVKTEKGRKWSVGISAGNTPYASSRSFEGMSRLNSRSLYASPINMAAVSEMIIRQLIARYCLIIVIVVLRPMYIIKCQLRLELR